MSRKRIFFTTSILAVLAIVLFIYPLTNQSVKADQVNSIGYETIIALQKATGLTNICLLNVDNNILTKYFKTEIQKVLVQPGCATVRVYFGTPLEGKPRIVIIGVDKYGKNILSGVLVGPISYCPPFC